MPPRIKAPSTALPSPSMHTHCTACLRRSFSTTLSRGITIMTKPKKEMYAWLETSGKNFKQPPEAGKTNYLTQYTKGSNYRQQGERLSESFDDNKRSGDPSLQQVENMLTQKAPEPVEGEDDDEDGGAELAQRGGGRRSKRAYRPESMKAKRVFPLNPNFMSQSILSEALRLEVWKRVQVDKQSVRQVSADMQIDMRRVGAVVRLVEIEKRMRAENQPLALPYAASIHSMLPTTPYNPSTPSLIAAHETINDLPHHPLTAPQLFYPTSESRPFNRTDAGRVFSAAPQLLHTKDISTGGQPSREPWEDTTPEIIGKPGLERPVLKPADARVPHGELIKLEADLATATGDSSRREAIQQAHAAHAQRLKADEESRAEMFRRREQKREAVRTRLHRGKWEWVVQNVKVSDVGVGNGKGGNGVGTKYGVPSQDRKRGNVRIPRGVAI